MEVSNKYNEISIKYIKNYCGDDGFEKIEKIAREYFEEVDLKSISYSYIINLLLFTYNYMNVNNEYNLSRYLCLKKEELKKYIYICKSQINDYNSKAWNKLRFYKIIKKMLMDIAEDLNDFEKTCTFEDKKDIIEYLVNSYKEYDVSNSNKKHQPYPLFEDIIGLDDAKKVIKEKIIDPLLYRDVFEKYDIKKCGGLLLFGLPGTGKTMFAQAVANEIDAHFIAVKASDIKSKYYGESENNLKEIFEEARQYETTVLFFDEFEAIGVSRDKIGAELTASNIVPELLAQIQGFEQNTNTIFLIAATNRPWDIDSALLRPGRFDSLIYIELPNKELRYKMIKENLKNISIEEDIIEYLSKETNNYNGADIKNICDQIIRIVINKEIEDVIDYRITFEDCVEILKKTKSSVSSYDIERINIFKNMRRE